MKKNYSTGVPISTVFANCKTTTVTREHGFLCGHEYLREEKRDYEFKDCPLICDIQIISCLCDYCAERQSVS